ncbi:hypothetical protein GC174_14005 [bacterium]|nr:hypothetical protein [bacterium]
MSTLDGEIGKVGDGASALGNQSRLNITRVVDMTDRSRPLQFAGELEEPQFLPEVRIFGGERESGDQVSPRQIGELPGDRDIGNLEEKEYKAANAPWLKQFKENQPDYEKSLDKADRYLSEKRKAYLDRMMPGQPDGLEAEVDKGLKALNVSKANLASAIDGFPGEDERLSAAIITTQYIDQIASQFPEAEREKADILEQMKQSGFGVLIKPLQDYEKTILQYRPAFQERVDLGAQYLGAIKNKSSLNDIYARGLAKAGRVEPENRSFQTRKDQLMLENQRLKEEGSKVFVLPEFDPLPRIKEDEEGIYRI